MGSDSDLPVMQACGLGIAVADAHPLVLARADLVTRLGGGVGAGRIGGLAGRADLDLEQAHLADAGAAQGAEAGGGDEPQQNHDRDRDADEPAARSDADGVLALGGEPHAGQELRRAPRLLQERDGVLQQGEIACHGGTEGDAHGRFRSQYACARAPGARDSRVSAVS